MSLACSTVRFSPRNCVACCLGRWFKVYSAKLHVLYFKVRGKRKLSKYQIRLSVVRRHHQPQNASFDHPRGNPSLCSLHLELTAVKGRLPEVTTPEASLLYSSICCSAGDSKRCPFPSLLSHPSTKIPRHHKTHATIGAESF